MTPSRTAPIGLHALLALALLAAAAFAHFSHHLLDPGCDEGRTHPCASCSTLHASAIHEDSSAPVPARGSRPAGSHAPEIDAPAATPAAACAPRAPPAA